ncbi:hypothetical protein [Nitratifractor salsuginis]|uniref:Uncharacterized protein n=1 Tax=Nitratifractor salsuginis (strain DSM 16511 / JCM 12458 / E9I37-1) TaxID=749222 RepID=E6X0F9_NITSE|nr:hypothetical protein [Nitratifractor salsuginis]ADV46809.1 hypothetical protein Nitsa_1561 [Nitratifractor salsuginis DSM 16511]
MNFHMFEQCADVSCHNIFAWLNQGPLTLTLTLHTIIILPMIWIYFSEKKKLQNK